MGPVIVEPVRSSLGRTWAAAARRRASTTARLAGVALLLLGAAGRTAWAQSADLDGVGFVLGQESAPVTIVEYADFACSACAEFARDTWPTLRSEYVESGTVQWRFVPFELGFRNSDEGARAAQCGHEMGSFWTLHDLLYERQAEWAGERNPEDQLVEIAVAAGLEEDAFRSCYDDDPGEERTEAANDAADDDDIRGTPTFFINGFRVQGALPVDTFRQLIDTAQAPGGP